MLFKLIPRLRAYQSYLCPSALFPNLVGSNPRTSFLLGNKLKDFFCFSFISETFGNKRKSSRTASSKEHECATVILFQTNMPEQRVISQPNELQRLCSEHGKSQNNGLATGALFFSSPHLALRTRFALRAKCCVRLAWLIKRLLCRLTYKQPFNIRAFELTSWALGRNFNKSEAKLCYFLKIFFVGTKKTEATYLKTSNQLLLNRLPLRKTVCST